MTNQADTAVDKELAQEASGELEAVTQAEDAPAVEEDTPVASEAVEVSADAEPAQAAHETVTEARTVAEAAVETPEVEPSEVIADSSETPEVVEVLAEVEPVTEAEPEVSMAEAMALEASALEEAGPKLDEPEVIAEPTGTAELVEAVSEGYPLPTAPGDDVQRPAGEGAPAESAPIEQDENTEVIVNEDGSTQVVRMLAVGQQIEGVVKRITDFGAFIDIGVGRDGLIHISELSTRRVAKVADVLSEGQEILPWIKKLDRQRNRISLTLIDPETKTIRDVEKGDVVEGTVSRILPYGAFIDIGIGRDALLHVREMGEGFVAKPEDVVQVGEKIEVRIIELSRRRGRVDLSLKGLREEPAAAASAAYEQTAPGAAEVEEEPQDQFEDVEVLSPMQLAFKKAVEADGGEVKVEKKQGKRGKRNQGRSLQDEIIARTLDTGRK